MENPQPTSTKVAFKWTIISLVTSIVFTYVTQFLSVDPNSAIKYIQYLIFAAFLVLAQKEFKDQLGGYLTFGQGFNVGLLYSIFAGLLGAIFVYIYLTYLSPQVFEQSMTAAEQKLQEKGMSSDQIETVMGFTRKYGVILGSVFAAIGSVILGIIVALISSSVLKKERSPLDIQDPSFPDPSV